MLICLPPHRTLRLNIRDASFHFFLFLLLEAVKSINRAEKALPSCAYGGPLPFPDSSRWTCTDWGLKVNVNTELLSLFSTKG